MLSISVVGIGNAGSQVAALAKTQLNIPVLAINSSKNDLLTVPESVPSFLIGDEKGAGKERAMAKEFLKKDILKIIDDPAAKEVFQNEIVFVVSSTGGGTGSGTSVVLHSILSEVYPNAKCILVGILPTLKEALSTQVNSLAYMEELYKVASKVTYMLYDNNKLVKLPSHIMMQSINNSIVNDMDVIRGTYQLPTRFSSIDERDAGNLYATSGRLMIARVNNIMEKDLDEMDIEDYIIKSLKENAHCELQRDGIVYRTGVISNLSDKLNARFDTHLPKVQEFIGAPTEEFEHIVVNEERHIPNNVFFIAAGLTQVNDRIRKINDRIEEIQEMQKKMEEDSELETFNAQELTSKIDRNRPDTSDSKVDIQSIFNKFGA